MEELKISVSNSISNTGEIISEYETWYCDNNNNLIILNENGYVLKCIHFEHWFMIEGNNNAKD